MQIRLGLVSAYSPLYGVHKHGALLDKAAAFGVKTVSVCDMNNLYGVHTFIEAAKERNIKPVIGAALGASESNDRLRCADSAVYCFVENRAGFSRLCEILSVRDKEPKKFDPLPLLRENARGLILASCEDEVLRYLAGNVKRLYAAITPLDIRAVETGRRLNIPSAFLDNCVFLEEGNSQSRLFWAAHRVLRAIALNKTIGNLKPEETAKKESVMRSSKELHSLLASWPQAVKGTREIEALCTFNDLFDGWIFPAYEAKTSAVEELRRRVYEGASLRYGELGDYEIERIEYELGIIEEKGFPSYFLIIDDIVKMAKANKGSKRTCGRGSGAASIVSYGLGITNVDPLRHDLYFERFLNPSRPDPPDLDIDFAWDERDDLIKAVIEKFGADHCARVANHNFFRYRSALRETAKAYGFGDAEITAMERRLFQMKEKSLSAADPLWREIFLVAEKIEGLVRGLGMHCGGLVITPRPVYNYAPVEKSLEGYPLLAWEKEGAEEAGFVKIDLLGNRSLAVIRDALNNLEEQGIYIDPDTWSPVDDKPTIEALARGDSIGVFYIESPAMRQLQKKTKAGDFDHIVIHSSIIRPAANKFISEYVRRLKGGKWEALHPRLEKILDETYGILCYQEDVSKTAVALAGFNEADADKLRKVIAKKAGAAKLKIYEKQFFEGCEKNGVNYETTKKIWEMMLSFDGYSFCKPHSASYAMVSYQSAYLRVHHPAEFMAAVLSNQGGFYRPHAYIAEVRRMGLFTSGPDVNLSRWKYYSARTNTASSGGVVIGLMAVKGLSVSGASAILEERQRGGGFLSLEDFSRRVKLNRDDIIALCPAGVFDSIAGNTPRYLQARRLLAANTRAAAGQSELFSVDKPASIAPKEKTNVKTSADLWGEYEALGFLRNAHPLVLWKDDVLAVRNRVKASRIGQHIGQNVKMVGWQTAHKDVWTKDGQTMCFLSLEDETGLYETVVFPQVYERYNKLLFDQQPLLVYGSLVDDQGAISLEIKSIEVLIGNLSDH